MGWPVEVSHDIDTVVAKSDVVYLLRLQNERMTEQFLPTLREYTATYGLTLDAPASSARPLWLCTRADATGYRDRGRSGRSSVFCHHRPGSQRRGRADGRPLPAPGSGADWRVNARSWSRGGTVVDATGTPWADVLVKGEVVADVGPKLDRAGRRHRARRRRLLCGSRPGRPAHHLREPGAEDPRRSRRGPSGGARWLYRRSRYAEHRAGGRLGRRRQPFLDLAKGACCDVRPAGTITVGRQGQALRPWPRWPPWVCVSSPMTAPA